MFSKWIYLNDSEVTAHSLFGKNKLVNGIFFLIVIFAIMNMLVVFMKLDSNFYNYNKNVLGVLFPPPEVKSKQSMIGFIAAFSNVIYIIFAYSLVKLKSKKVFIAIILMVIIAPIFDAIVQGIIANYFGGDAAIIVGEVLVMSFF